MRILTPYKEDVGLVREIFRRTGDYIKTKEILLKTYDIKIWLETK